MKVTDPLKLPCGEVLPNRLVKSALSENLADDDFAPKKEFINLYSRWLSGGTGLVVSGNVMVDKKYLDEPYNVVIDKDLDNFNDLKKWSNIQQNFSGHLWIQLNHPGKQIPKYLCKEPLAPSAIALRPPLDKVFNTPRELTTNEILEIIERFAYAAEVVKDAGFKGVQIHGAHGYLVSQFLSPRHNKRSDEWGGSPDKRMKFLIEVYSAMRSRVGDSFPIGLKLNSADFSKGGFTHEESLNVAKKMSELGVDLIEISGGSYETPVMMKGDRKESTIKREAYFLEYAKDIKKLIQTPLMVTGGFRSSDFISEVVENDEVDMVGLGRPLCIDPDFSNKVLNNLSVTSDVKPLTTGSKKLDHLVPLEIIWYTEQIHRMAHEKKPNPKLSVFSVILKTTLKTGLHSFTRSRT